jgi:ribosomal protein L14
MSYNEKKSTKGLVMKDTLQRTKNFVRRHKGTIIVASVTGIVIVAQANGINKLNNFLKEKDLFDEYYFNDED